MRPGRWLVSLLPYNGVRREVPAGATSAVAGKRLMGVGTALLELLRRLLMPLIRSHVQPERIDELELDLERPVCFVLENHALSNLLILDTQCLRASLPRPVAPLQAASLPSGRSYVAMTRRQRTLGRARRGPPPGLQALVDAAEADTDLDVQLVPVSIFLGRSPEKQRGWLKILFSENWALAGPTRRLFSVLVHGRQTMVQFGQPLSVRDVVDEGAGRDRAARKLARVLRVHFRGIRTAVLGPDLSHRRTMVRGLLSSQAIQAAVSAEAERYGISERAAAERARRYAYEIAADYSHPFVRFMERLLTYLWNRIYDGIEVNHIDALRRVAPGNEIVYVPCHRSHFDYLLLSYVVYQAGLVPPHIAAGVNLNLPLIGRLMRRGGAFFIRRSFRGNQLYTAVFREYVSWLFSKGVAMEYFIEGGRSRTGLLLQPRSGMLAMTARSFLREFSRPVVFVPVYIGYEEIAEAESYSGELQGQAKQKESIRGFLRSFRILRRRFGKVHVNFGEPIYLGEHLDDYHPGWRGESHAPDYRPAWLSPAVSALAHRIMTRINRAADVNAANLLGLVLLATPRQAMDEADLARQLEISMGLLTECPYSDRVTLPAMTGREIIDYGLELRFIEREQHPLGDIIHVRDSAATTLSYFRNNVLHLFALPSLIACCFLNNRYFSESRISALAQIVYPALRAQLFLTWSRSEFRGAVTAMIEVMRHYGLLVGEGDELARPAGGSRAAMQLETLAHGVLQTFQRYYIAIALLVKRGPGRLTRGDLERLCQLTAQRMSMLYEFNPPDFFDRATFRSFIDVLSRNEIIWTQEDGTLSFGETVHTINEDARVILSKKVRHSIIQVTPEA